MCPDVDQLVGACPYTKRKVMGSIPNSGHMPRLQVSRPVGFVREAKNKYFSLSLKTIKTPQLNKQNGTFS